jgi:hypothetical protein
MGKIKPAPLGKVFIGILSREENLYRVFSLIEEEFSDIDFRSEIIPFDFTNYYKREMGFPLLRVWVSIKGLSPQDNLVRLKKIAIDLEDKTRVEDKRIYNLDPGILTESRVTLATTKDYSHRLYLGEGIYGEVTLIYRRGEGYIPLPWTYPDYRTETARKFFMRMRELLREEKNA